MQIYGYLIWNHWKNVRRALRQRDRWLTLLAIGVMLFNLTIILVFTGTFLDKILDYYYREFRHNFAGSPVSPAIFVNKYLLEMFMGLFSLRFFLQQGPKMQMQPYLHLPIRREKLVQFFQIFSLLSFHNAIPYLFFVPFTINFIYKTGYGVQSTIIWFAGITLVLLFSHYANNLLRALHKKNSFYYLVTVSLLALLFLLDEIVDMHILRSFSEILFGRLLEGDVLFLVLLISLTVTMYIFSGFQIQNQLLINPSSDSAYRTNQRSITFAPERGQVINLILLEMKMIWRNKRPKHYFILSIVFALAYIALMLAESNVFNTQAVSAVIGIFASGTFALNYGQLMFSWESTYFDGFMTRNIRPEELIVAKLMILQGSCLVFFLISLPLFILMSPDLLLLHVTFLFYNAGVTSVLMLALAIRNHKRVNISKSGSFFNYEGFSAMHWLWILPTIIPPALLLNLLGNIQWTALLCIGGLGVLNLVLSRQWSQFFTERFMTRKYLMATGFRQHES